MSEFLVVKEVFHASNNISAIIHMECNPALPSDYGNDDSCNLDPYDRLALESKVDEVPRPLSCHRFIYVAGEQLPVTL